MQPLRDEFGDLVPEVLYRGTGCRNCQGTGYRGRQGVFEMMGISDEIRSLILHQSPSHELRKVAVTQGMKSLREDGWRLVRRARRRWTRSCRTRRTKRRARSLRRSAHRFDYRFFCRLRLRGSKSVLSDPRSRKRQISNHVD